jgi:hypothetical protein
MRNFQTHMSVIGAHRDAAPGTRMSRHERQQMFATGDVACVQRFDLVEWPGRS